MRKTVTRQTDFPELAEKEIKFEYLDNFNTKIIKRGLVIDANYFIGITIVDANNTDMILCCANYKNAVIMNIVNSYTDVFYSLIEQIKNNAVDWTIIDNIITSHDVQEYSNRKHNICPWR